MEQDHHTGSLKRENGTGSAYR